MHGPAAQVVKELVGSPVSQFQESCRQFEVCLKSTSCRLWLQLCRRSLRESIEMVRITSQERTCERVDELIVDVAMPQRFGGEPPILLWNRQIHKSSAGAVQRTVEQIVNVSMPQVVEEIVEVVQITCQERIAKRRQIVDVTMPQVLVEHSRSRKEKGPKSKPKQMLSELQCEQVESDILEPSFMEDSVEFEVGESHCRSMCSTAQGLQEPMDKEVSVSTNSKKVKRRNKVG